MSGIFMSSSSGMYIKHFSYPLCACNEENAVMLRQAGSRLRRAKTGRRGATTLLIFTCRAFSSQVQPPQTQLQSTTLRSSTPTQRKRVRLYNAMMAAIAPSAFSTSTSSLRASQSQAAPVSYSDSPLTQLPTVDIPFDDLRRRMAEFTVRFDAFIEKGRKRVLEERNEYKARMSELTGKHTSNYAAGED